MIAKTDEAKNRMMPTRRFSLGEGAGLVPTIHMHSIAPAREMRANASPVMVFVKFMRIGFGIY